MKTLYIPLADYIPIMDKKGWHTAQLISMSDNIKACRLNLFLFQETDGPDILFTNLIDWEKLGFLQFDDLQDRQICDILQSIKYVSRSN